VIERGLTALQDALRRRDIYVAGADTSPVQLVASNGVVWTRTPGGRSKPDDLLRILSGFTKGLVEREWDWWQEGRQQKESAQRWAVLREWDNGAPQPEEPADDDALAEAALDDHELWLEAERQRRADLAAKRYDKDRELLRLTLLRAEADGAFFAHVLEAPASRAQQETAERRVAERSAAAKELRGKLGGDPDDVVDSNGYSAPFRYIEPPFCMLKQAFTHPAFRRGRGLSFGVPPIDGLPGISWSEWLVSE
jgi:hypothetical protein